MPFKQSPFEKPGTRSSTAPSEDQDIPGRDAVRIADPLGDMKPSGTGRLASAPDREGLLGVGSQALPDGGNPQHPVHDESSDDSPDEYEKMFDEARNTGFEPRDDDADVQERDAETDEDEADFEPDDEPR